MMLCARCGGLLVRERLFEANGMSSTERVDCERCLNCGAVEDAIIRANRHAVGVPVRSRQPRGPRSHSSRVSAREDLSLETNLTDILPRLSVPGPYLYAACSENHVHGRLMEAEGNE